MPIFNPPSTGDADVAAAIDAHEQATNPHPVYVTGNDANTLVAAAVDAHAQATDPHPAYVTGNDANTSIAAAVDAHAQAADPHPAYVTGDEANTSIAAAVDAHAQAADPHSQYVKASDTVGLAVAVAQITGTWATSSTNYTQLGGADFQVAISAKAGDHILISPPPLSWTAYVQIRLKINGVHELLGDAVSGKQQVTWGAGYSGGSNAAHYLGVLPIGNPVIYIAPNEGTFVIAIDVKVSSGNAVYLGRGGPGAGSSPISQLFALNLGSSATP